MRWLTWMATFALIGVGGCGGGDDSAAPAPAGAEKTAPPGGGATTPPAGGSATTAAPGSGTENPPSTGGQGQLGAATSGQPAVKEAMAPPTPASAPATPGVPNAAAPEVKPTPEPEATTEAGPPEMPQVHLGQGPFAQSTLLKVGDTIPKIELANVDGDPTTVPPPAAGELLVLVFWDSMNAYSTLELRWLQRDLADQNGVRVVAINRGETAETVRPIVEKDALSFPVLLDADASVFGQFASETVPRTYLVGEGGKILWLEVTFQGRSTIRTLQQAIAAAQAE
jgi:peroxiredoxin